MDIEALAETMTLTELVRLQDTLSRALVRRFERPLAVMFSDIVGSTPYFARFGNEAGRKLQQRHVDRLAAVVPAHRGRIVDTAGDGAFLAFPEPVDAARAAVALVEQVVADNDARTEDHRLVLRIGIHWGSVLTDGTLVSGDAVNTCARIAGTATPQEIRLSVAAWAELSDSMLRLRCRRLRDTALKGLGSMELVSLDWRDPERFPSRVRFEDGSELPLPTRDPIRFGRLPDQPGEPGNDIVLTAADPTRQNRISRFQFELVRRSSGFVLRSVSSASTEVDGRLVVRGEEVPVGLGTTVRVAGVLTLQLLGAAHQADATLLSHG